MQILYTVQQIRDLEQIAFQQYSIPEFQLMQLAGQAAFDVLLQCWPNAKSVVVLCGSGNNGGDGFVLAALAKQHGLTVKLYYLGDLNKSSATAQQAQLFCKAAGVEIKPYHGNTILQADVLVDALLGIGLKGDVRQPYADVIQTMNCCNIPVLAIDNPSGLDVDSGQPLGACVRATVTCTFIGLKRGLFTDKAVDYCGQVVLNDLQLSTKLYQYVTTTSKKITINDFQQFLPKRPRNAHKGMFGHVLVVGGNHGMAGAALMTALAAARVGAGLITVATRPQHVELIINERPELMCKGIETANDLQPLLDKASVVAIGPGLGTDQWAQSLWQAVLTTDLPIVLDADGLNLLAEHKAQSDHWVLTPHPGEAKRLLQAISTEQITDRYQLAVTLQKNYHGVVVLKGAGTIIQSLQQTAVCDAGNAGMASGGMGDVLTGVIASLIAQGLTLEQAAQMGVCLHAAAGDLAAQQGERGLLAMDLLPYLRELVNKN